MCALKVSFYLNTTSYRKSTSTNLELIYVWLMLQEIFLVALIWEAFLEEIRVTTFFAQQDKSALWHRFVFPIFTFK